MGYSSQTLPLALKGPAAFFSGVVNWRSDGAEKTASRRLNFVATPTKRGIIIFDEVCFFIGHWRARVSCQSLVDEEACRYCALYRSKKARLGTIRFFEESDDVLTRERRALVHDLEGAVGRNELSLVYQPLWDRRENRVTGFEALLRWRHPVRGLVPPDEFIPIVEESGLILGYPPRVCNAAELAIRRQDCC
jgi:hypothetical protein